MKVLVVEDIEIIRKQLVQALAEVPKVEVVWHGPHEPEVIHATRQTQPDVVILNILVTQIERNGFVFDEVAGIQQIEPRPMIIILGDRHDSHYDELYEREILKRGVDLYLDRTHEMDKMPQLLAKFIESRNQNM